VKTAAAEEGPGADTASLRRAGSSFDRLSELGARSCRDRGAAVASLGPVNVEMQRQGIVRVPAQVVSIVGAAENAVNKRCSMNRVGGSVRRRVGRIGVLNVAAVGAEVEAGEEVKNKSVEVVGAAAGLVIVAGRGTATMVCASDQACVADLADQSSGCVAVVVAAAAAAVVVVVGGCGGGCQWVQPSKRTRGRGIWGHMFRRQTCSFERKKRGDGGGVGGNRRVDKSAR